MSRAPAWLAPSCPPVARDREATTPTCWLRNSAQLDSWNRSSPGRSGGAAGVTSTGAEDRVGIDTDARLVIAIPSTALPEGMSERRGTGSRASMLGVAAATGLETCAG